MALVSVVAMLAVSAGVRHDVPQAGTDPSADSVRAGAHESWQRCGGRRPPLRAAPRPQSSVGVDHPDRPSLSLRDLGQAGRRVHAARRPDHEQQVRLLHPLDGTRPLPRRQLFVEPDYAGADRAAAVLATRWRNGLVQCQGVLVLWSIGCRGLPSAPARQAARGEQAGGAVARVARSPMIDRLERPAAMPGDGRSIGTEAEASSRPTTSMLSSAIATTSSTGVGGLPSFRWPGLRMRYAGSLGDVRHACVRVCGRADEPPRGAAAHADVLRQRSIG